MKQFHRLGFSLLEIMIVVAVVGIMTAAIIRVAVRKPSDEWNTLLERINVMLAQTQQEAILAQRTHRLRFSTKGGVTITIEKQQPNKEKPDQVVYDKIATPRVENPFTLPSTMSLQAVLINGVNQLNGQSKNASLYVTKEGIVQPAILHFSRGRKNEESKKSFVVQPFLGTCELHSGFIKQ